MELFCRSEIQKIGVSQKEKNKKAITDNENIQDSEKQINTIEKTNEKESESMQENIIAETKKKNKKKKKKKLNQPAKVIENVTIPKDRKRKLGVKDVVNEKRSKVGSHGSDKNQSFQSKNKSLRNKSLKLNEKSKEESSLNKMSDARLLAYGIKPKKFRNKLKYNNQSKS